MLWGANWWDAAQAIGTTAAVVVALLLAAWESYRHRTTQKELSGLKQKEAERAEIGQAGLVSAWVEHSYQPSRNGTHYSLTAHVYVANESNDPVFDVHVTIGTGDPVVQIGPLSVPMPISVVPPRRTRTWDISLPLMAHSPAVGQLPAEPVARLSFSTPQGKRWHRNFEGKLSQKLAETSTYLQNDPEVGERQLGDLENPYNPMQIALSFFSAATADPPARYQDVAPMLAPTAPGWANFSERWPEICEMVEGYGLAAHVVYPAPRIAYVKLVHDDDSKKEVSEAGYITVRALVATLIFLPDIGWRLFSIGAGATAPEWVPFPSNSLLAEVKKDPE